MTPQDDADLLEQQRLGHMDRWMAARAEAGRIIAERNTMPNWQEWAAEQVRQSKHEGMLRRILGGHLEKPRAIHL